MLEDSRKRKDMITTYKFLNLFDNVSIKKVFEIGWNQLTTRHKKKLS